MISNKKIQENSWIEVSKQAIINNVSIFKKLASDHRKLMIVVKANAYGHGMVLTAKAALEGGADKLGVFSFKEGKELRSAHIKCPILILGPVQKNQISEAAHLNLIITLASLEGVKQYASLNLINSSIHLKVETGTNRQGITMSEIPGVLAILGDNNIKIEGVYTHFADIEDTTDHSFALLQLQSFNEILELITKSGFKVPYPHTACTAAAILFPHTYFSMLRVGIGTYGLWPSKETIVSAQAQGKDRLKLIPAMKWKTRIIQIKSIKSGEFVGYGRTYKATRDSKIAILPVGYSDGYSRAFSNTAYTLVQGQRARVAGRICMNLTMLDVTDIPNVSINDEVTLLGQEGDEVISAEYLASIAGTINYEIVTRAAPGAPRVYSELKIS